MWHIFCLSCVRCRAAKSAKALLWGKDASAQYENDRLVRESRDNRGAGTPRNLPFNMFSRLDGISRRSTVDLFSKYRAYLQSCRRGVFRAAGLTVCDYLRGHSATLPILWLCDRGEFLKEAARLGAGFYLNDPPEDVAKQKIISQIEQATQSRSLVPQCKERRLWRKK